ncbi:hypothetical protein GDO78_004371 [Eleutherodactylus coqui]|uniref:Uncharacterized protein n=1 Tax=Eleutherodactylus coqui TaxID=57060 RepID=A0A8J6EQP5_ELECQ|nr:hypothetical protein GDO78_004371 [Eleutherodactylus coqui]
MVRCERFCHAHKLRRCIQPGSYIKNKIGHKIRPLFRWQNDCFAWLDPKNGSHILKSDPVMSVVVSELICFLMHTYFHVHIITFQGVNRDRNLEE